MLLALIILAAIPAQAASSNEKRQVKRKQAAVKEPLKVGDPAPMFALREFGGDFVFLKRYCGENRGNSEVKAVLLDFFATDCESCVAKLPEIQLLARRHEPKLKVFLVSIDPKPEAVLPGFLKEKEIALPVLMDLYRKTFVNYGFRAVPQTVLVDKDCKAVYVAGKDDKISSIADSLKILLNSTINK